MSSHVFLSYVRENSALVYRLKVELNNRNITTWRDQDDLRLGSRRKPAIKRAIQGADFFIACFSEAYNHHGEARMNEELQIAIEKLRQHPPGHTWLIPAKLSPCEIPEFDISGNVTLRGLQYVDLYTDWNAGIERLTAALLARPAGSSPLPPSPSEPQSEKAAHRLSGTGKDAAKQMEIVLEKVNSRLTDLSQNGDDESIKQDRTLSVKIKDLTTDELKISQ
jgi:hypothetical protein